MSNRVKGGFDCFMRKEGYIRVYNRTGLHIGWTKKLPTWKQRALELLRGRGFMIRVVGFDYD